MKYAEMQATVNPSAGGKGKGSDTPSCEATDPGQTLPLLVNVEAETWLANRLLQHGCDLYAGGPYASYADRLGAAIVRNGVQCVIVGRREGKPENYRQYFERVCSKALPKTADVPRGTAPYQHNNLGD